MTDSGVMFGDDDDEMGGGGPGLSLELDVKGGPPVRASMGAAAISSHSGGPPAPPHPMPSFRPIPATAMDRRAAVAPVESFEARMLGNFGEPPAQFWRAPLYAWRVRQRLAQLRVELKARRQQAERATTAVEQALVALGQRARGTAERNPAYGRTLDVLRTHEQTLRQRDGALMGEMDAHSRTLAQIDQKIAELQAAATAVQIEERRVADELGVVQATVQRAEAKLKRLDIDLRSVFGPNDPRRGAP